MARLPKPTKLNMRTAVSFFINRLNGGKFTLVALVKSLEGSGFTNQCLSMELLRREKINLIVDTGEKQTHGVGRPVKVYRQKWVS